MNQRDSKKAILPVPIGFLLVLLCRHFHTALSVGTSMMIIRKIKKKLENPTFGVE